MKQPTHFIEVLFSHGKLRNCYPAKIEHFQTIRLTYFVWKIYPKSQHSETYLKAIKN